MAFNIENLEKILNKMSNNYNLYLIFLIHEKTSGSYPVISG